MAQGMYQQTDPSAGQQTAKNAHGSTPSADNDEVVDAEYEEVN